MRLKKSILFSVVALLTVLTAVVAGFSVSGARASGISKTPTSLRDTPAWAHLSSAAQSAILRNLGVHSSAVANAHPFVGHRVNPNVTNSAVNNLTTDATTTQSETSLAVFGSTVVAAYNDSLNSEYTGYSVSADGGSTWTDDGYLSPLPGTGGQDLGDPAVVTDNKGDFFVANLAQNSSGEFIALYKCSVSGTTITCGSYIQVSSPASGTSTFNDKDYITYNPLKNQIVVTWTYFNSSGGTTLKMRFYDIKTATLAMTHDLTVVSSQGTNPVVDNKGTIYVFFEAFNGNVESISYVKYDSGKVSSVKNVATINASAGNINCGGQTEEAFSTEAFSTSHAARVVEFPAAVVDKNNNIDVTWNSAPSAGGIANVYVATLNANTNVWHVQALPNPTNLIQWQPWVAVTGTRLAVTYFQVVNVNNSYQIERVQANATIGTKPVFSAAFPISSTTWAADQTNPNFDPAIAACYMGDYSASFGKGLQIYSVWGDNRNNVQPDVYSAIQ